MLKNEMRENDLRSKTVRIHINKLSNWQRKYIQKIYNGKKNSIMNCIHDKYKIRIFMNN